MDLNIRVDDSNCTHTRFTLFLDGVNCGKLSMRTYEAYRLITVLMTGVRSSTKTRLTGRRLWVATKGK